MTINDYVINYGEKPNMLFFQYRSGNSERYCALDIAFKDNRVLALLTSPVCSCYSVTNDAEAIINQLFIMLRLNDLISTPEQLSVFLLHFRPHLMENKVPFIASHVELEYTDLTITQVKQFNLVENKNIPFNLTDFIQPE